ncbi:unnamed protein product [Prunus armeniaca]|uniref:Uncharacterized protein n=1 Tax=Prunus armeniaca TaxID=36596 RepID=A0A6J5YC04_PRUAR|nr:unnamed protein product [Prunus armeniaca]
MAPASPGLNLHVVHREDETEGNDVIVHYMKWGLITSFTKKTEKPDYYKMVIAFTFVADP